MKKWWETRRLVFNVYIILSGLLCLITMRLLNRASVNFFMAPFLLFYLLLLNIGYTLFYILFCKRVEQDDINLIKRKFNGLVIGVILVDILLAYLIVTTIPHH